MVCQACILLAAQCGAALAAPRRLEQQGAASRSMPFAVSPGNGETGSRQHWPSCKPSISTQCLGCNLCLGSMLVNTGYKSQSKSKCQHHLHSSALPFNPVFLFWLQLYWFQALSILTWNPPAMHPGSIFFWKPEMCSRIDHTLNMEPSILIQIVEPFIQ